MTNDIIATDAEAIVKKDKLIRYSEIFSSFQGEGFKTGAQTLWLRLWGCNLECNLFGQKDLDDPSTWIMPYKDFDTSLIKVVEDLPVWHVGCDSSYSWSKKFMKFAHKNTAAEIAQKLIDLNKNIYNESGLFEHPRSKQETHMAFTGGEPMMNQRAIIDIMEEMHKIGKNSPVKVTVETNGTQELKEDFKTFMQERFYRYENIDGMIDPERQSASEWFWSISPKLRTSGEKWEDAIKPEVVASYSDISPYGQLKYVVDGDDRTWYEVEQATKAFRDAGCDFPVTIMPVGADVEMQNEHAAKIAREAIARGYHTSARVHSYVFGNIIGS